MIVFQFHLGVCVYRIIYQATEIKCALICGVFFTLIVN